MSLTPLEGTVVRVNFSAYKKKNFKTLEKILNRINGPAKGKDVKPHWNHMLDVYYKHMGWDRKSGRPLAETLRKLGLDAEARDLWGL